MLRQPAAAAAGSPQDQASSLAHVVSVFKVDARVAAPTPAMAPRLTRTVTQSTLIAA